MMLEAISMRIGFGECVLVTEPKVRVRREFTFHSSWANTAYCFWCSLLGASEA